MRENRPQSLHDNELDLAHEPLTTPPTPVPIEAWIRYGTTAVNVRGVAIEWTPKAVNVRYPAPDGTEHQAWVWASAARRLH